VTIEEFFAVLNPGGRDRTQAFPHGAGQPADPGHPPVNYHGYAACCHGGFFRKVAEIPASVRVVLVLLRRKGLHDALKALRELKKAGKKVLVSWKESGLHQVSGALEDSGRYEIFRTLCGEADGFLSSTPDLVSLYQAAGATGGGFLPTPYPVDEPAWDFSRPVAERAGIFIGTREFDVPSRNHLRAVALASSLGQVTVINPDGGKGERLLHAISPNLRIISGQLPYSEYLRLMASHRLVFQLDRSAVPGQVAGDALLCRLPCMGGDGAIDRLAFPGLCGSVHSAEEVLQSAARLLSDDDEYGRQIAASQELAKQMSFGAVARRLREIAA